MRYYQTILALHIIFAGIWIIFFAADIILKNQIRTTDSKEAKNKLISLYLQFTNLFGIVGAIGIAISGIVLVVLNPGYGFFDMSHAHWLATKQILFVIILLNTFLRIIPAAKKLRAAMENDDTEILDQQYNSVTKINMLLNILVILNFIFAITHRFYA
jgi:uncharacterized membrane protein